MDKDKIIKELDAMNMDGDPETDHARADTLLLEYLHATGHGEVAAAFERARDRVGFWYA